MPEVRFYPENLVVVVPEGSTIMEAALKAGLPLKSTCGGEGSCGRCAVKVEKGQVKLKGKASPRYLKEEGYILACQAVIESDLSVFVPAESVLGKHRVLGSEERLEEGSLFLKETYPFTPLTDLFSLNLPEPNRLDNIGDTTRLLASLKKEYRREAKIDLSLVKKLPDELRKNNWQIDVILSRFSDRIIDLLPQNKGKNFGVAIDVGTTTIAASLFDLKNGQKIASQGDYNRQAVCGDDVIARIIFATEEENGLELLREKALETINGLISSLITKAGIRQEEITVAVVAGNTIMIHLLLGINPAYLRLEPYTPALNEVPVLSAAEVGLKISERAEVYIFPAVASYLGGDIVSGVFYCQLAKKDELTLFIDIGTNGEMVLGNKDWLISCSCSAGPAFEGSGISCGMRAADGAIEGVVIDPVTYEVELEVVGEGRPLGICGSGLIDCLAEMKRKNVIDRSGNFLEVPTDRLRSGEEGLEFVLSYAFESAHGKDIVITSADIKNLMRSKAAVFAGIESLLKTLSLELAAIDKIIIAGGFGNYLNINNAVEIGLLPDLPPQKYIFIGNTSLKGAETVLCSADGWREALELGKSITYLDLSGGNLFMEEFVSALFIPHTNLDLFPSVKEEENKRSPVLDGIQYRSGR